MVTCDQQDKVLSSQTVLLWIFLEIRYQIWRYAELNRFFVCSGLIPLNIKLKQDDRTVCCNHKIVTATTLWTLPQYTQQCFYTAKTLCCYLWQCILFNGPYHYHVIELGQNTVHCSRILQHYIAALHYDTTLQHYIVALQHYTALWP